MSSSSKKFYSSEDIEKKNSETTTNEEDEMQKYEKRILQSILDEKIIPTDLKYWSFFHLLKPEFISQIYMIYDIHICDNGVIIVTKDKNVYNLDYKRKCIESGDTYVTLKKIKELCGKNIKTFAYSKIFILALTEEGEVYFCEITEKPNFSNKISTFIQVDHLSNKRVVDIGCGKRHGLALTSDGKVYTWGMINWDEIDLDQSFDERNWKANVSEESDSEENDSQVNKNIAHFVPRQVKHELEKKKVVSIACGAELNIVVTDENTIYGWGYNNDGQISIVRPQEYYKHPRKIITISDKIVKVVCGKRHTLALTSKGEVYAWGANYCGQIGVNNNKNFSDPIVVNVPQMGKVLNVDAFGNMSVAVGYDRSIYIWGKCWDKFLDDKIIQPFRTKFSRIFDVHSMRRRMHKPLVVHDSVRITNNYNYKHTEEILNILQFLGAAFDDPLTSDITIQVKGQPIYVHKAILKIRCQYFLDSILDSSPVYIISDKFSYIVYKAFLKYLYTGIIDLPLQNALELMELADMYYKTNLKKDCSLIIKPNITMSNVDFLYNKAIAYNAEELKEFCFQFVLRHRTANTLSEDYIKLDMSTKTKIEHKELIQNDVTITSSTFYSPNKNVEERNSKTTTKKNEMQKNEKRILQILEKVMDFKNWLFFHLLTSEFIPQIHMLYGDYNCKATIYIVTKDKNVYSLNYDKNYDENYDEDDYSSNGSIYTAPHLKEVKELCGKNITTFAHNYEFIMALTEEGELYFSEIAKYGRRTESTFIRVINLSDEGIVDIACGELNGLALTRNGKVYVWKDWKNNVSEKSDWEENVSEERDWEENVSEERDWEENVSEERDLEENVSEERDWEENVSEEHDWEENVSEERDWENVSEEYDWDENIVYIACGLSFNIAVSDENTIYGWGDNNQGEISIVESQDFYKYPHEIITISDKIVKVVCGYSHTLALTSKGEVYAWGANYYGQIGINSNEKPSGPIVVNIPEMGKVLNIAAYCDSSIAVGSNKIIYVWGKFFKDFETNIPFPTKFSSFHDAFAHSYWRTMRYKYLHKSLMYANNFKYVEELANILESLRAIFDDPLTSDLTIQVEGRPIYVHKAILKIRCQYFKNMFQHDWIENIRSISDSVYTVSEKFSYVVYKAFLKYLYTGQIDLPLENALELLELADMYCVTNLIKDSSEIIKEVITVSNVAFFYNKAIEYNAKELEEFCFQFALRHMTAVVLSEDFIKLDTSIKDNFMRKAAEGNTFGISFF